MQSVSASTAQLGQDRRERMWWGDRTIVLKPQSRLGLSECQSFFPGRGVQAFQAFIKRIVSPLTHIEHLTFAFFGFQIYCRKIKALEKGRSTVNRGHEHQRSIRCCSARAGRPRRFGGTQRDSGT
jgi:hypothetical protein